MFKKTLTYETFDGETITEDFYFNLTEAELTDMQYSTAGGLQNILEKIVNTKDQPKMIQYMKDILKKTYGVKSDDGKRFIKTPEVVEQFTQTQAYSDYFMTLALDADEATAFIKGILPKKYSGEVEKAIKDYTGK